MKKSEFRDYVVEDLLEGIPGITSRAMFGGFGLYKEKIIFGIIVEGELYFKSDESNRGDYESLNSRPFTYERKDGKVVVMSYWLVPEEVMEDKEKLRELVSKSARISKLKSC